MKYTIEKQHAIHMPMNHRRLVAMPCCFGRVFVAVYILMDTALPFLGVSTVADGNVALLIPTIVVVYIDFQVLYARQVFGSLLRETGYVLVVCSLFAPKPESFRIFLAGNKWA
jgi:hypothetical protein